MQECDKTFVDPTRLRVHMRIHLGQKPFACARCGKAFTQKRTLDEHLRIHDREEGGESLPFR